MLDRFYRPGPLTDQVTLEDSEAHHLLHVLRKQVGDRVELFDGQGGAADAEIVRLSKKSAELRIVTNHPEPEPAGPRLTIATAVPKGDRFRWLVEKATELGVDALIPLDTTRSVVAARGGKLEKMEQATIAACKQCGRNRLLEVRPALSWTALLHEIFPGHQALVAHPAGRSWSDVMGSLDPARPLLFAIGPEGGFTDEEIAQAVAAGGKCVRLGESILRIETAAVAVAAGVRLWGQQDASSKTSL